MCYEYYIMILSHGGETMTKSVYTPIRLDPVMYDALETIANETDLTISAVIREAIRLYLEARGGKAE